MELNYVQFLQNKTILITGATGFLGKVFVEKLLRVQPNVKKLYLLMRASDTEAAMKRLHAEVLEKDLFKVLKENLGEEKLNTLLLEKVVPVAGDTSKNNLDVKDPNLIECMQNEIDIIVNHAATTNFDERYDVSLGINTFGPLNVLNFAKKCSKSKLLLHVSTAYVCVKKSGLIQEKPFEMGETLNGRGRLVIENEIEIINEKLKELQQQNNSEEEIALFMKDLGMSRAKLHGWPNTYVFTKSMGEMLLGVHRDKLPLVIIRPTMITSTISEPFPGWIEGLRTVDSVIIAYGKGLLKCFLVDLNLVCDMIPVDMVTNAMIAIAAANAGCLNTHMVYHVGSSHQNPITFRKIYELSERYYTKNPLVRRNGSIIRVSSVRFISTMTWFKFNMNLRYKLPVKTLKVIEKINPWRNGNKYKDTDRKIKSVMRMVELYKPYVLFKGIFKDSNTESLYVKEKDEEKKVFDFDPKGINWEDYLTNIHIPGLITHVLRK